MRAAPTRGLSEGGALLDRGRIVARAGFNRWLVPPAALALHLCIGMAYGFSVFWLPLTHTLGPDAACPTLGTLDALLTTTCEWRVKDVQMMYTLFFIFLGSSAALWGGWLERVGPRKAGVAAALCWCGGMLVCALGIWAHQLALLWLGGAVGGVGLGLGYISPVSTLIKWFPDRRGMATGMAIMGFGGGAMIGSPLANILMNHFKSAAGAGVWQTFVVMACLYFVCMLTGAFSYRVPPSGWRLRGPRANEGAHEGANSAAAAPSGPAPGAGGDIGHGVRPRDAQRTRQFWLIWVVLCLNVSAGIGVIGMASPMLQEIFAGALIGAPGVGFKDLTADQAKAVATIGAAFTGLISLFNIGGRFFWSSLSDRLGRRRTFTIFFALGIILYTLAPTLAHGGQVSLFVCAICVIMSMYGGGFAAVPAYLADIFGARFVGAIHGRLLTAWSVAGVIGPTVVAYIRDAELVLGVPRDHLYDVTLYVLALFLVVGLLANLAVKPLEPQWFMRAPTAAGLAGTQEHGAETGPQDRPGEGGDIGRGGVSPTVLMAWALVALPIAWGVYMTLRTAAPLFG